MDYLKLLFSSRCWIIWIISNCVRTLFHVIVLGCEGIFPDWFLVFFSRAATCPRCHHGEAYFRQMQIRSADEPMTTFYQCCNENCHFEWRDDWTLLTPPPFSSCLMKFLTVNLYGENCVNLLALRNYDWKPNILVFLKY